MSKYALRLVHFLSEDKPINEYFIPFSSGALLNLLKTDFSKVIEDVFFSDVEYIKELLNKREGTLESFLRRYNLFDVKDQNGYNYFVDLTKEDFADEEWRANDPEDIYEYSLWDYFADARLILDTVQIREPENNVAEVQAINDEAEATMFSRSELFLQKVIFSIIVAIDSGEEGEQFIPPTIPEDYLEYFKSGSFADSLDEIEKLTYVFLNDYISDMPYSLYAASYDYIYKLFKIIVGDKVTQYKLVEYMDKLHKSLWEVSNKRPFDFIKNMKTYLGEELFVRSLLMCDWAVFFINAFPKGQKILYSIKDILYGMKDIFSSSPNEEKDWKEIIEKYYPEKQGCFCVVLTDDDKIYFALSGFDYQGGKIIRPKIECFKKLAKYIISELNLKKDSYCSLNDATKRYTEIQSSRNSIKYIQGDPKFVYFFKDIKNNKINTQKLGAMFGCCERKILGFIELSQGKKDNYGKISFFSRWAPCEKCMPAIYLQKKYCFYAFADSFNSLENNNMELSKYEVDGHYNSRYWLKKQIIHNSYYSNEKKQADIVDDVEDCKNKDYILLGVIGNKNTKEIKAYSVFSVSTGTILEKTEVEIVGRYDLFININSNLPNYLKYITELKNICNGKYTHFKERCNHNKEDKINDNTLICGGNADFALILNNNEIVSKYKYIRIGIDDEKAIFCDIELQKVYYGSKHAFILKDDKGNKTIKYCYTDNTNEYCYRDLAKDGGISDSIVYNIEKIIKADGWYRIDDDEDVSQNQLLILGKPKFLTVKLKKAANSKTSMYISSTVLDIDISSFKYGNSIFGNINLIQVSKGIENQSLEKVIEACLIDKLLAEIEDGNISGSLIEVRTSELRKQIAHEVRTSELRKRIAHEVELLDETDRRIEGISIERY